MGGDGYVRDRVVVSHSGFVQFRSIEKFGRSGAPRRRPSGRYGVSDWRLRACMEEARLGRVVVRGSVS